MPLITSAMSTVPKRSRGTAGGGVTAASGAGSAAGAAAGGVAAAQAVVARGSLPAGGRRSASLSRAPENSSLASDAKGVASTSTASLAASDTVCSGAGSLSPPSAQGGGVKQRERASRRSVAQQAIVSKRQCQNEKAVSGRGGGGAQAVSPGVLSPEGEASASESLPCAATSASVVVASSRVVVVLPHVSSVALPAP